MSSGWIKIHRQVKNHWVYSKPEYFYWWFDILSEVNFEDKKVVIGETLFECKRGQSLYSTITWSKRWKVSKSKTYRFLKMLEKDNMITLKSETQTTRLTVCKYDTYQENGNTDETQVKRKRNASETEVKTTKEVKEIKNNNMSDFETFWTLYDHKHKKAVAKKLWSKLKKTEINLIMDHIVKYKGETPDKTFRLYPDKYIRQRKWEDDDGKQLTESDKLKLKYNYKPLGA